jgi:hypothetical protein
MYYIIEGRCKKRMKTDAETFFEKFTSRICKDKFWNLYHKVADFTPEVTKEINAIINEMGYRSQNEYFRIDATGWQGKYEMVEKLAEAVKMNAHLWDLKIAVEHENNPKDWTDELVKLVHIRCPLKVVIGYNYSDKRDEDEKKLDYASICMNMTSAFDNNGKEEYLVILGNCHPKEKGKSYEEFDYRGYLYSYADKKFAELN